MPRTSSPGRSRCRAPPCGRSASGCIDWAGPSPARRGRAGRSAAVPRRPRASESNESTSAASRSVSRRISAASSLSGCSCCRYSAFARITASGVAARARRRRRTRAGARTPPRTGDSDLPARNQPPTAATTRPPPAQQHERQEAVEGVLLGLRRSRHLDTQRRGSAASSRSAASPLALDRAHVRRSRSRPARTGGSTGCRCCARVRRTPRCRRRCRGPVGGRARRRRATLLVLRLDAGGGDVQAVVDVRPQLVLLELVHGRAQGEQEQRKRRRRTRPSGGCGFW